MRNSTTDLAVIRKSLQAPFTWGAPIRLYEVGPYAILEYHPWKTDGPTLLTGTPDFTQIEFHGWIDGDDASCGFSSLDAALAGLIAIRHDGPNTQAAYYFMRGLKSDEK